MDVTLCISSPLLEPRIRSISHEVLELRVWEKWHPPPKETGELMAEEGEINTEFFKKKKKNSYSLMHFPIGSVVNNPPANAGDLGSMPG